MAAQYRVWRVTSLRRVAFCSRYLHGGADFATVNVSGQGHASWGGLRTCGSIWACTMCAAKIRQRRAESIDHIAKSHATAGGGLGFCTITLPHGRDDSLAQLLDAVLDGWRVVQQARSVRAVLAKYGCIGTIRATEVTRGYRGWHPHAHLLLFVGRPLTAQEWAEVEAAIYAAWARYVVARGFREPSRAHGIRLDPVDVTKSTEGLALYLSKVQDSYGGRASIARELARGDAKRGRKTSRNPFQLAESAAGGHGGDLKLWHEYETATKGRKAVVIPTGLSKRYGVQLDSDETIAARDEPTAVAAVSADEYALVVRYRYRARVCDRAERDGATGVYELVRVLYARDDYERTRAARRRGKP